MRVLCCGPESSGTRLLARIVDTGNRIEAVHRSIPHWKSWDLWSEDEVGHIDRAIYIQRAWTPTIRSQMARELVACETEAIDHLRQALVTFASTVRVPFWIVTYQMLVEHPDVVLAELSRFLGGVELSLPDGESIYDGNHKWIDPDE